MKVNTRVVALAGALASGIYFTIGSALFILFPEQSLKTMASLFLLNSFGPLTNYFDLSLQTFATGLISYMFCTYLFVFLFAYLYNMIIDNVDKSNSSRRSRK